MRVIRGDGYGQGRNESGGAGLFVATRRRWTSTESLQVILDHNTATRPCRSRAPCPARRDMAARTWAAALALLTLAAGGSAAGVGGEMVLRDSFFCLAGMPLQNL